MTTVILIIILISMYLSCHVKMSHRTKGFIVAAVVYKIHSFDSNSHLKLL